MTREELDQIKNAGLIVKLPGQSSPLPLDSAVFEVHNVSDTEEEELPQGLYIRSASGPIPINTVSHFESVSSQLQRIAEVMVAEISDSEQEDS